MTTILVTRPPAAANPLVVELERRGYRVAAVPTVVTREVPANWPDLSIYDWVVLTSAAGVAALPPGSTARRWAAVGQSTATLLRAKVSAEPFVPLRTNAAGLASEMPDAAGSRILLVRGSLAGDDLSAGLRHRGAKVDDITVYETVEGPAESVGALRLALAEPDLAAVVFASGSAARGFLKLGGSTTLPAITIGARTSEVARRAGFSIIAEAASPDVEELAAAVARAIPVEVGRPWPS